MIARIGRTLRHWFVPHVSNNFRAKILHNTGWLAVIGIFLALQLFTRTLDSSAIHILGFTSSITIDEVVSKTNAERAAQGLQPLRYNETLADAARRKAANMFEENYWAHNSPSGKSPWVWFTAAGYKYAHAGENLGKDFGSTDRLVSAWMGSPTHKANIVSDKFNEIGIAVVPGSLLGQDTVLVVQLFGSTSNQGQVPVTTSETPQVAEVRGAVVPVSKSAATTPVITPAPTSTGAPVPTPTPTPAPTMMPVENEVMELKELESVIENPTLNRINEFDVRRAMSLVTTGLLILVLLADVLIAESRQLSRRVGKNWGHIVFINVILILVAIVNAGQII